MSIKKLVSKKLSLEYTKSEIALILISGFVLVMLNYLMITGLKPIHSADNHVEQVRLSR